MPFIKSTEIVAFLKNKGWIFYEIYIAKIEYYVKYKGSFKFLAIELNFF